jgi:gluconate 2-dehydrogenase gamma chain
MRRRDLLKYPLPALAFQQAHQHVEQSKQQNAGVYAPKLFTPHEWQTLRRLSELILPGAVEAGAPDYVDYLSSNNQRLAVIFTGGLAWLDHEMQSRSAATFLAATPAQQTALLDLIAFRKNEAPELAAGIRFFAWARRMTVDAYYTSKAGVADLNYMGNGGSATFEVPAASLQYALNRSPK